MAEPTKADFAAILRGLELLLQAVQTLDERQANHHAIQTKKLDILIDALSPREGDENPLHDLLNRIVQLLEGIDGKADAILAHRPKPNGTVGGPPS